MATWPDVLEWMPRAALFAIVFARAVGMVMTAPNWGLAGVGPRQRVLLALGLAIVLTPLVGPSIAIPMSDSVAWLGLIPLELGIGGALGLSGALVVAGARQAGELIALHAGLSPAGLLDIEPERGWGPVDLGTGNNALTPLGHLHGLIALAVFLALDGPMVLVRALASSFRSAPPGLGLVEGAGSTEAARGLALDLFSRSGSTLGLALQAAAPAGLALLVSGLALAWLSRTSSGRPLSGLDWPVRVALGLVVAAFSLATLAATLAAAWSAWAVSIHGN